MFRSILLLAAFVPTVATAQGGAALEAVGGEPRIVATATRSARIPADRGQVLAIVEVSGETPAEATQRASNKLQVVIAALRATGLGADVITSTPLGVTPLSGREQFGSTSTTQVVARYMIRVQVSRPDQVMAITSAALAAGASMTGAQLNESSASDAVRRSHNADALATARSDAEGLATAMGGKLGPILEVTTNSPAAVNFGGLNMPFMLSRFDYSGQFQPPDVTITSTVTVRYRFLPR